MIGGVVGGFRKWRLTVPAGQAGPVAKKGGAGPFGPAPKHSGNRTGPWLHSRSRRLNLRGIPRWKRGGLPGVASVPVHPTSHWAWSIVERGTNAWACQPRSPVSRLSLRCWAKRLPKRACSRKFAHGTSEGRTEPCDFGCRGSGTAAGLAQSVNALDTMVTRHVIRTRAGPCLTHGAGSGRLTARTDRFEKFARTMNALPGCGFQADMFAWRLRVRVICNLRERQTPRRRWALRSREGRTPNRF
jgi:hypothetical protein